MLVFYYCWKRGREVRLANETEAAQLDGKPADTAKGDDDDDDEIEIEVTDEDDEEETDDRKPTDEEIAKSVEEKVKVLDQKDPAQIALPAEVKEEK